MATKIKPAASTPNNTRRSQRSNTPRPSSSIAKMTPARGALNAAAKPPAAPVAMSSLAVNPLNAMPYRRQILPHHNITAAPTCTDGPSRPTDAPMSMARKVRGIFHRVCPKATNRCLSA